MAKDPAFLFYPGDYLRDTQTLSEKSQVAYDRIMCEHMRNICISKQQLKFFTKKLNPDELEELMFVLSENEAGYYIEWVAESIEKRKAYSESRRNNRIKKNKKDMNNISKTYDKHMENENENENKDINAREENFKKEVYKNSNYKKSMLDEFINYWTQKNTNGKKMHFEKQTTFEITKRLATWYNKSKVFNNNQTHIQHDSDF